jgi:hypothetical protein
MKVEHSSGDTTKMYSTTPKLHSFTEKKQIKIGSDFYLKKENMVNTEEFGR